MTDSPLEAASRSVSRLVSTLPGPVRRIRLQYADVVVDVEWPISPKVDGAAGLAPAVVEESVEPDVHHVCAAMVGTFYRAEKPGADPFVREGDTVAAGQQVAILEAMKMMMPVAADLSGQVTRVLVDDGTPVEYGQRLIAIAPPTAD